MAVDEAGLSRARSKEKNNQADAGARSNTGTKHIKLARATKSNPKSGGGINRSLAGKP